MPEDCICEYRGDLRVGTHADCPVHGRMLREVQESVIDALEAENQRLREALVELLAWAYPMPGYHQAVQVRQAEQALAAVVEE